MQFLKKTLNEKDKIHQNILQEIATKTKEKDKRKNKLNFYELKIKKMEDIYNCLANEINKLTGNIKKIDGLVLKICSLNDSACV